MVYLKSSTCDWPYQRTSTMRKIVVITFACVHGILVFRFVRTRGTCYGKVRSASHISLHHPPTHSLSPEPDDVPDMAHLAPPIFNRMCVCGILSAPLDTRWWFFYSCRHSWLYRLDALLLNRWSQQKRGFVTLLVKLLLSVELSRNLLVTRDQVFPFCRQVLILFTFFRQDQMGMISMKADFYGWLHRKGAPRILRSACEWQTSGWNLFRIIHSARLVEILSYSMSFVATVLRTQWERLLNIEIKKRSAAWKEPQVSYKSKPWVMTQTEIPNLYDFVSLMWNSVI